MTCVNSSPALNQTKFMIRGDSKAYKFQRKDREGNILTDKPTTLFFTLKTSFNTKDFVLQKTLDNMYITEDGYWHFVLNPQDTEELPYGKYCWDIQVVQDGFKTTISRGFLVLSNESTWKENENA